jgi:hypothetical protein
MAFRFGDRQPENILDRPSCRQCNPLDINELGLRPPPAVRQRDHFGRDRLAKDGNCDHFSPQSPSPNRAPPNADCRAFDEQ